tara:strand:- start:3306 stop:3476 length:171 start_codon:yes stop_codon:yes gene_type:complete
MISTHDKIKEVLDQWIDKGCIDPHTELICKTVVSVVKELERTNLLLLEILNRETLK